MKNFFIGLIICLEENKEAPVKSILKRYVTEQIKKTYKGAEILDKFSDHHFLENLDKDAKIVVTEYAPKIFKNIRSLENLSESSIIESLKPMFNSKAVRSQGKGGSFFITTDDSKIIIKTLKQSEFNYMFGTFLFYYYHHLESYPDSLVCRIYGIYSVKCSRDIEPMLVIIMRDARGPLREVK